MAHGLEVGYDVRVREQSSATLASARRRELALSADHEARDRLLNLAKENEPQAFAPTLFADALFREESAETFREGYVFRPGPGMKAPRHDLSDWGYWVCDIADYERLAWSDRVYDLFGLPIGMPIDRDWAVGRYLVHSRATLQRVREFALRHACGFILDAEIAPAGACGRWIRILALPVYENGRIARLHGLKRAL